ncbi:respiratory nitrate reductase subunit gamma [Candidatus Vesicomyidisocius calyptogenae]|uniref:nitrate reductase (quinone) n=1 Tax=Vesicomyosocius okutanii subsp. Calyptogena okutanii (strain HA) TaxID=412965 RepID=A5CWA3_VESOH|nr:respiratory nitrate reductase subunit gamma [Candidatus Vesicomyosocius okutanii]BAF61759.1 respiratory nitrate reductase gamma subunit [Candidatus Vesicomyosocius okutanii]
MNTFLDQFFFGYYPYVAMTMFIVGSALRYDRDQYTWKADSSQLLRKKGMLWGSNLFHIGIILLFFGHFVGLLTPEWVYHPFMSAGTKQIIAMTVGSIFGTMCLVGMLILLNRRLFDKRIRKTSKFSDTFILIYLFVQLLLGLLTVPYSTQHLDGSSMIALANWAQYITSFRMGATDFIVSEAWVFKLHLILGMTLFAIFPFTRLVHIWSVPVQYLTRTNYQIVRRR